MGAAASFLIALGLALAGMFCFFALYNRLVRLRNQYKNAFAQIDVQLKRRYDLIPNLVETAQGYLKDEREVLEAVILARNQAAAAEKRALANPGDQGAIAGLIGAEGELRGALGRFFALVEAYPDLKGNQNMMQLNEELTSTESRISFALQAFNDAVMFYNNARQVFPGMIVANALDFAPAGLLELENPAERIASPNLTASPADPAPPAPSP